MVLPADPIALARAQSLGAALRRTAARLPDKTALICGSVRWTYAEFDTVVDGLAAALLRRGLKHADRIAILSRNSHAFAALRFAAARAGLTIVPVNFMLNAREVAYILAHSGARWLFVDQANLAVGAEAAAACPNIEHLIGLPSEHSADCPAGPEPFEALRGDDDGPLDERGGGDDVAQVIYTSGTESRPKGVLLTHASILWQYQSCIAELEIHRDDIFLHALPMFHCAQLDTFLGPCITAGATSYLTADAGPDHLIALLERSGATSFFAPPTVWIGLLETGQLARTVGSRLRKAYYGASIMPKDVLARLRGELPAIRFWNCYGQSEIAPLATVLKPEDHDAHPGSVGRPVLNVMTRLVDDEGADVVAGAIGEIVHRSPQLMLGYLNDPEKTAEAFAGGWFHSGDLATVDRDGFISIVDRKKDMIKSGGENVASSEVENALLSHPAVLEAAVVGLPDPKWVEAVAAIVVVREGQAVRGEALIAHCSRMLARFKVPKIVHVVGQLPKNPSGKVLKRELRIMFSPGEPQ